MRLDRHVGIDQTHGEAATVGMSHLVGLELATIGEKEEIRRFHAESLVVSWSVTQIFEKVRADRD